MAKVLFFFQLVVGLVVLPLVPGFGSGYVLWGAGYLGLVVTLPFVGAGAVFGARAVTRALADAWSPVPLGPRSRDSVAVWTMAVRLFPLAGLLGGLVSVVGALTSFSVQRPLGPQILVLASFCLVWGFLGFLLGRILSEVVAHLSSAAPPSVTTLETGVGLGAGLTPREIEVAQVILDGLTYKDAATKLAIGASTVKAHLLSVYRKTGAGNKIELLRWVEAETTRLHQKVNGPETARSRS